MKKILLVVPEDTLDIDPMVYPPLGLLYIAAVLEKYGHQVNIFDMRKNNIEDMPLADFYCFTATTPQIKNEIKVSNYVRLNFGGITIIGGAHASWVHDSVKEHFDAVVIGEGEDVILDIVNNNTRGVINANLVRKGDINQIPFPSRHLMEDEAIVSKNLWEGYAFRKIDSPIATTLITSRGCPWKCAFCLPKNTKILTADMQWLNIQSIKVGERIIGVKKENRWKYVESMVVAFHEREAMVYAIETENGTVYSTKEHPWLMGRDWKSIEDIENTKKYNARFDSTRAVLRKLSDPTPVYTETEDYKWGYISGAIAGDGCLKLQHHKRPYGEYDYMRLSISGDYEMLDRVLKYARDLELPLKERKVSYKKYYKCNRLVICNKHKICERIKDIIYNKEETEEYVRGFLGGIFDAEGSGKSVVRIHNYDEKLIKRIVNYLTKYRFKTVYDYRKDKISAVRIVGGQSEYVRFMATTMPAVKHKKGGILGETLNNKTRIKKVYPVGKMQVYNLTTTSNNFIADGFITHNCANLPQSIRFRSAENVVEEIKEIINNYNCNHFRFLDDNFILKKSRLKELTNQLKDLDIHYRCSGRSDIIDAEICEMLVTSGCGEIGLGVESGDSNVLRIIEKRETLEDHRRAIKLAKSFGLITKVFLMAGLPGETWESIEMTKRFIEETKPDKWAASLFTPFPGSPVANNPAAYNVEFVERDFTKYVQSPPTKSIIKTDVASSEELGQHYEELMRYLKNLYNV